MNMRSSIAAALLLASVAGISACDPNATLVAKNTTSPAAATVEADHAIPHAVYPVEARYAAPGPYATTEISYALSSGEVYEIFRPASYAALGFLSPIVTWGDGTGGSPDDTSVFLRHLASWGFTVIGVDL